MNCCEMYAYDVNHGPRIDQMPQVLCLYMYMCVCIIAGCMLMEIVTNTYIHTYVRAYVCTRIDTYNIYIHMLLSAYIYTYTYKRICTCILCQLLILFSAQSILMLNISILMLNISILMLNISILMLDNYVHVCMRACTCAYAYK